MGQLAFSLVWLTRFAWWTLEQEARQRRSPSTPAELINDSRASEFVVHPFGWLVLATTTRLRRRHK